MHSLWFLHFHVRSRCLCAARQTSESKGTCQSTNGHRVCGNVHTRDCGEHVLVTSSGHKYLTAMFAIPSTLEQIFKGSSLHSLTRMMRILTSQRSILHFSPSRAQHMACRRLWVMGSWCIYLVILLLFNTLLDILSFSCIVYFWSGRLTIAG